MVKPRLTLVKGGRAAPALTAMEITNIRVSILLRLNKISIEQRKRNDPLYLADKQAQLKAIMEKLWNMRKEIENAKR